MAQAKATEVAPKKRPIKKAGKKAGKAVAAAARRTAAKRPVRTHAHGFMDFVRKQGVVGLAVGLAIGTQASELVKNIVSSVITPIVNLLVGNDGLKGLTWYLEIGERSGKFDFGLLIDSTIKFLAVAIVIYFVILGLKLDKLDKNSK